MSENRTTTKNRIASKGRVNLFGVSIDNLSMDETVSRVEEFIRTGQPHQHVVVNVNKIIKAQKDGSLQKIICNASLVNADGMPVVWASRMFGKSIKERVAGIDLFQKLLELADQKGYRVYFLGAERKALDDMVYILMRRYPHLDIAGYHDGFWNPDEEENIITEIASAKADLVFVAIPSPEKEYFIDRNLTKFNARFVMGVGGSFDVLSGRTKRAPHWMQKCGLEWFYRFLQEPGRLFKRYFIEGVGFLKLLIQESFSKK